MAYYSKKSIWKWIIIYLIIGGVIYALIYYFFLAKNGGYSYNAQEYNQQYNNNYHQTPNNNQTQNYQNPQKNNTNTTIQQHTNNTQTGTNVPRSTITITSPKGGETWTASYAYTITWSSTGNMTTGYRITLLNLSKNTTHIIANNLPTTRTSYAWTIPSDGSIPSGDTYEIAMVSGSVDGLSKTFKIVAPSVTSW